VAVMQHYISSPKNTLRILSDYGIRLRKSLGQNYIIDTNSIKKMVSLAGIRPGESILEVGSGIGSLTEIIIGNGAGKVACIEIDKKISTAFKDIFKEEIDNSSIILFTMDAMDVDYNWLSSEYGIEKLISNPPYKIASPLILKILMEAPRIKSLYLTIQKDIADRIMARMGDKNYSSFTLKSNLLADYKQCFTISRNCFIPKPFVDSLVLEARRRPLPDGFIDYSEVRIFFNFINSSFLHRRKKMLNSLSFSSDYKGKLVNISKLLKERGKDNSVRAENLTLYDYLYIFKNLQANPNCK
jgi:16S rRNA (adenine1518-N6/adenine1519-N6)-dimethyltransferase